MQFSPSVTTVTRNTIVRKSFDTINRGSPGLMYFLQNPEEWKSGVQYTIVIQYQDSTNGGNIGIADKLDTNRVDTQVQMNFNPHMAYAPVVVANIEMVLNEGDERVLELLSTQFDIQGKHLMNIMSGNLYVGTGAGNSWDSLAMAADDSTNYSTYGGLARSTYTSLKGYYLASAGATTLAKLATAYDSVQVGIDMPQLILTTKSIWSTYESLLTPIVRAGYVQNGYPRMNAFGMVPTSEALAGTQGFEVLFFRGTPVVKDEQIPAGNIYLVNTNYFGFKGIDMSSAGLKRTNFKEKNDGTPKGVPGRVPSTLGFNFRDMITPVDQLAEVGHLVYAGDFISENPRLLGHMVGAS